MSLPNAARAAEEFVKVMDEAQDLVTAGAIGDIFDDVVRHAGDLLDIMAEELRTLDRSRHANLFAAAPILRQKLERLRDELRGGTAH